MTGDVIAGMGTGVISFVTVLGTILLIRTALLTLVDRNRPYPERLVASRFYMTGACLVSVFLFLTIVWASVKGPLSP